MDNPALPSKSSQSIAKVNSQPQTLTTINDYNAHLSKELLIMVEHASSRGIQLPQGLELDNLSDTKILIQNYNIVAQAIQPTNVKSIEYIDKEILQANGEKRLFNIPIFTKCIFIAVFALILMISVSLLPSVNAENLKKGLLNSSGLELFYNLIFICSASLLGVMFYLLKTISDKVKSYTLLPIDAIEVNMTILIGVISGFVIAELFTFNTNSLNQYVEMQKMTLALLGGFSSDGIFTVLQSIVQKVKQLVTT